ncbi:hypothetical protein [Flavobacterium sp.]|uniref:hypothetical protein n=1 Tax=Flavobacterium sp. TaxID=239 RepID=UPI0011F73ABC|nr:hypothetical protein [Flavobacterium sp.]RZJ70508.1 MAG: hypothetical protein EOO49_13695 [Flavobacterium sp.]
MYLLPESIRAFVAKNPKKIGGFLPPKRPGILPRIREFSFRALENSRFKIDTKLATNTRMYLLPNSIRAFVAKNPKKIGGFLPHKKSRILPRFRELAV